MRDQRPDEDQGEHGRPAVDLHEPGRRGPGPQNFPGDASRKKDEQRGIEQDPLDHGKEVHPSLRTRAQTRPASSSARRGASMHGFVRASAVMQSAAITVTAGAPTPPAWGWS